jgi:hypothetical protein
VARVKVSKPVTVQFRDVASAQAIERIWRDAAKVVRSEAYTVRRRRERTQRHVVNSPAG